MEAARRQTAQESLTEFVKQIDVPGAPVDEDDPECETFYAERLVPAQHHRLIIEVLERVERGELCRVILLMPPGSAKSTYATVCFPPWYLGKKQGRSVISASYGAPLADKFGRRCRRIASSREYYEIMEARLRGGEAAAANWSLSNGSLYMATGILASVTGNRADGLVIDDPIKGREDADSPTVRDKTWEAYKSDLRTRLKPGGFIIWILTRWHEDDPVGRILPDNYGGESGWITARDGERWYVLSLQAECERADDPLGREIGEFIWPEWFKDLAQEKITQGSRNWNALYQQRPALEEGAYFKADWLRYYDTAPARETMKIYGASDYAVTADDGDFTVHGIAGVDPNDDLYILDWWRRQTESDVWVEQLLNLIQVWQPMEWGEEAGQILKSVGPFINKRMTETRIYCVRKPFTSAADKPTRAQSFRARMAQGKVYLPRNAPWTPALVSEILIFPNGTLDDQIDVLSLFGRMLMRMTKGKDEPTPPGPISTLDHVKMDRLWEDKEEGFRSFRDRS